MIELQVAPQVHILLSTTGVTPDAAAPVLGSGLHAGT